MNRLLIPAMALCITACSGGSDESIEAGGTDPISTVSNHNAASFKGLSLDDYISTAPEGPNDSIKRFDTYNGDLSPTKAYLETVSYDPATDTFTVADLPFDGDGTYDRDDVVASLNGFNVYENNNVTERRAYKALNGTSKSGKTNISIVKTGSYSDIGFGGFVYARNGSVTLPTNGQATFTGNYAGTRVFDGETGQQYTTGSALLEVDFNKINREEAVEGIIFDRQVFDLDGNLVNLVDGNDVAYALPTLVLENGFLTDAGETTGGVVSTLDGSVFETGNYYAVLAGDNAEEIAGIILITSSDPSSSVIIEETGGFFAYD